MKLRIVILILLAASAVSADPTPVLHKFILWGSGWPKVERLALYLGWTNGFLYGRGYGAAELAGCLEQMGADQALAMIDKYYRDHPERWSRSFTDEVLRALTVDGGPCQGKNVWSQGWSR
jgi:hypothetical protein